jgi:hypothetical protein
MGTTQDSPTPGTENLHPGLTGPPHIQTETKHKHPHTLTQVPQEHVEEGDVDGLMAAAVLLNLTQDHLRGETREYFRHEP